MSHRFTGGRTRLLVRLDVSDHALYQFYARSVCEKLKARIR